MLAPFLALCLATDAPLVADTLADLHARGRTFAEFLAGARRRTESWTGNYAWGKVDSELLARGRALSRTVKVLAVAEDGCSDSANTIPYLATFADSVGGRIDLRIVNSTEGRAVMEAHRTGDGRAATPTVIILGEAGGEAGCWVERPSALAAWMREQRGKLSQDALLEGKFKWYDEDRGRATVAEILEQIEQGGPGRPCGGNTASR